MTYLTQKTIKKNTSFSGISLHSGLNVEVRIKPAPPNHGIVFKRIDLKSNNLVYPNFMNVTNTSLNTTIENEFGVKVSTIEHLMAAFNGIGIDNIIVELNGPEVPIMDGSSLPFIEIIEGCGIKSLKAKRKILKILKKIEVMVDDDKLVVIRETNIICSYNG